MLHAQPIRHREVLANVSNIGLHAVHGGLEEGVGQVGDDGTEGVDVTRVDQLLLFESVRVNIK